MARKPFISGVLSTPSGYADDLFGEALTVEQWAALAPGDQLQVIRPTHGPLLMYGDVVTIDGILMGDALGCMVRVGVAEWCAGRFRLVRPNLEVTTPARSLTTELLALFTDGPS